MADLVQSGKSIHKSIGSNRNSYTPNMKRQQRPAMVRSHSITNVKDQSNMIKSAEFNNLPPLQRFSMARKKVNEIYRHIAEFVGDSSTFLYQFDQSSKLKIDVKEALVKLRGFNRQVTGIQEILARDQMKVCFFGRTSNGKSTVVNAMLEDKILPTGMGHTSNCFCSVSGGNDDESYLLTPSDEKLAVTNIKQLASALSHEKLEPNSLVRVYWPKDKCELLRDDVVLVDSPGIDVTPDLDSWINQHCLDADVFVLVVNSESTLMLTEKNFFYKVSERLSKPNIFILNNRWDASANEPEIMEEVKQQHLERNISFLVDELQVADKTVARDRVFFVSAKETLAARLKKQKGDLIEGVGFSEGFQIRLLEFERFEKIFKECISESAIKTKFEQHAKRGVNIVNSMKDLLQKLEREILSKKEQSRKERSICQKNLTRTKDRLDEEVSRFKIRTKRLTDNVEKQVADAMTQEINRLAYLVQDFDRPFHSHDVVMNAYKTELFKYIEEGLGRNLINRCSDTVNDSWNKTRKEIIGRLKEVLPLDFQKVAGVEDTIPAVPINYNLDCHTLCADFQENIQFKFTWGWRPLLRRALTFSNSTQLSRLFDDRQNESSKSGTETSTESTGVLAAVPTGIGASVALLTTYSSFGVVITAGVIWRMIGWRLFTVGTLIYGGLYAFERLTWTRGAQEQAFKKQFVNYARQKLKLVITVTSRNCSRQILSELTDTFNRLTNIMSKYKDTLEEQNNELKSQNQQLEDIENKIKHLSNRSLWLGNELQAFTETYLPHDANRSE